MFEHIIIDLDGTIYRGSEPIPGAQTAIETLRKQNISVTFLTNNATKRREKYSAKLETMGIPTTPEEVLTAGVITATYLGTNYPDCTLFVVGEEPFRTTLRNAGLTLTTSPERADGIVVALDREFNYETLSNALRVFEAGDPLYVATNPDQTRPGEHHSLPSTGSLIGAIEGMTDQRPDKILGKPSPVGGQVLTRERDIATDRTLFVGDRATTDIQFGEILGMETALVKTGVNNPAETMSEETRPDYVIESIAEVPSLLLDTQ